MKGGAGLIDDLWILADGRSNELGIRPGPNWIGKAEGERQLVVVFDKRILDGGSVPEDFDLRKSIVVSFEGERIRYYNFRAGYGGSFVRPIHREGE